MRISSKQVPGPKASIHAPRHIGFRVNTNHCKIRVSLIVHHSIVSRFRYQTSELPRNVLAVANTAQTKNRKDSERFICKHCCSISAVQDTVFYAAKPFKLCSWGATLLYTWRVLSRHFVEQQWARFHMVLDKKKGSFDDTFSNTVWRVVFSKSSHAACASAFNDMTEYATSVFWSKHGLFFWSGYLRQLSNEILPEIANYGAERGACKSHIKHQDMPNFCLLS